MNNIEKSEPVVNESYDAIDRHLRNSLDDESYANYSAHLENVYNNPPASVPLEKYNKLLDAAKDVCYNRGEVDYLRQAIAEAEGVDDEQRTA